MDKNILIQVGYLVSISLFVLGIKRLAKIKTARSANWLSGLAMAIAIVCQLAELDNVNYSAVIIGCIIGSFIGIALALKVAMTAMPQLVAVFNGFGGGASTLVALALFFASSKDAAISRLSIHGSSGQSVAVTMILSIIIGAVTFSGSIVAFLKLSDRWGKQLSRPVFLPARHWVNLGLIAILLINSYVWLEYDVSPAVSVFLALLISVISLLLGVLVVLPIGGADMPVVISLLNSYSGLAASATGFALQANVLIVSGALVGASGLILTSIMCKGMNRSLLNVMIGGFGAAPSVERDNSDYENVRSVDAEEAAMDFEDATNIIVVPGYGLAVAQGQNALAEFAGQLKERGARVRFAIHPVAGRMPGHMNVLLAEANVPYDELVEMDEINKDFKESDIAVVVGANDVVNPSAKEQPDSPLYGMPVLNVEEASRVYVIKRSLSPGFSGVKNSLFEKNNTHMIYGDAKKVLEELTQHLDAR